MNRLRLLAVAVPLLATSCAGVRSTGDLHTAHATSFNLLGLSVPANDQEVVWDMVPEDAEVLTALSTPNDWMSIVGLLTRIFGFSSSQVSWRGEAPQ